MGGVKKKGCSNQLDTTHSGFNAWHGNGGKDESFGLGNDTENDEKDKFYDQLDMEHSGFNAWHGNGGKYECFCSGKSHQQWW